MRESLVLMNRIFYNQNKPANGHYITTMESMFHAPFHTNEISIPQGYIRNQAVVIVILSVLIVMGYVHDKMNAVTLS